MDLKLLFPEKVFPVLYDDVMSLELFPDSKTFADAIPLLHPDEIEILYQKVNRTNKQEIINFIDQWFELPTPSHVSPLEKLPIKDHISSLWSVLIKKPSAQMQWSSLIPLPYPYVVPGGRFREIYYWDSYFTMLGLRESGRIKTIRDMINNFASLLEKFGHIPNGNRSYFLSRSQPPFFALMIELLAKTEGSEVLMEYQNHLLIEYKFWMDGSGNYSGTNKRVVNLGIEQYLNRYYDDSNSPRTESYAEDKRLFEESNSNDRELYRELRAACESGWDFSSRWQLIAEDLSSIHTTSFLPVDLNSLLYLLEKTIASSFSLNGNEATTYEFDSLANKRKSLMNQMLWNEEGGYFSDLNFRDHTFGVPSLAMMYPLFAGIATEDQADRTIEFVSSHFLKAGGWVTTEINTGQQWDAPNGWAPLQWITFVGLKKYGAIDLAREGAGRWLSLNEQVYNRTGRMMEKYNVEDVNLEAGGGEYPVQDGFGWTNGVYLALSGEL